MRSVQRHLTYANVVSTACLFIVLGGSAYAVTSIPANSVSGPALKRDAVTSIKVKDRSLLARDFRAGELLKGLPDPIPKLLPAGVTLRGAFFMVDTATATAADDLAAKHPQPAGTQISWGVRLPKTPVVHVVLKPPAPQIPECPGTDGAPTALPGNVCIYQTFPRTVPKVSIIPPTFIDYRAGLGLFSYATAPGLNEVSGTWAVTG